MTIYTRDEATKIADLLEDVLGNYDMDVPSPGDEEDREETEDAGCLFGSVYDGLLDDIENILLDGIDSDAATDEITDNVMAAFTSVLARFNILVPSDGEEREEGDTEPPFGQTRNRLRAEMKSVVDEIDTKNRNGANIVPLEYSGTI